MKANYRKIDLPLSYGIWDGGAGGRHLYLPVPPFPRPSVPSMGSEVSDS